jgi:hypothetical protein
VDYRLAKGDQEDGFARGLIDWFLAKFWISSDARVQTLSRAAPDFFQDFAPGQECLSGLGVSVFRRVMRYETPELTGNTTTTSVAPFTITAR